MTHWRTRNINPNRLSEADRRFIWCSIATVVFVLCIVGFVA